MARYMRSDLGIGHTKLGPPVIVEDSKSLDERHTRVYLVKDQRSKIDRTRRQTIVLPPYPVVTDPSIVYYGPRQLLTPKNDIARIVRRAAHSDLRPPAVVIAAATQIFFGPKVALNVMLRVRQRSTVTRRAPDYQLGAPTVIGDGIRFSGLYERLAVSKRQGIVTHSVLRQPVVVNQAVELSGPEITLAPSFRGKPKPDLRPPTDTVGIEDQGQIAITLAPSKRGKPKSRLFPPAVVGPILARPIFAHLAPQFRGKPKARLSAPVVVDYFRVPVVRVKLTYSLRGKAKSFLHAPTDLVDLQDQGRIAVHLVRIRPPRIGYDLAAPVVLNVGGNLGWLAVSLALSTRGKPKSKLSAPTVVDFSRLDFGPQVSLAHIKPPKTLPGLGDPAVIAQAQGPQGGIMVSLAPQRRPVTKSRLAPPVVVATAVQGQLQITLAPQPKPKAKSTYIYPIVVFLSKADGFTAIQLVRRPTPKTISKLSPPAVITAVVQIYYGPAVHLARARRPQAKSVLKPPTVVYLAVEIYGPEITLAPSTRGKPKSHLSLPTDTVGIEDQGQIAITLAPSKRGKPVFHLFPPTVIGPILARPVFIHLAPQFRGKPKSRLYAPIVVDYFRVPIVRVKLTYSLRGKPKSFLHAPTDLVDQQDVGRLAGHLTYSRRGRPIYRLAPPTVVFPFFPRDLPITLAPQRRGTPKSRLQSPVVVYLAVEIYGPEVTLSPSRRPIAKSHLAQPADITEAEEFPFVREHLTYSRRGTPKSRLQPPQVVYLAVEIYGPELHLTRIKPPPTMALLKPPADITEAEEFPVVRVTRTYSRRPITRSLLKPPTVVAPVVSYGPAVELAPSFRGIPKSHLGAPTVIDQPPAYSQVVPPTLTYSLRGKPKSFLRPPTVVFPFFARATDITLAPQRRGQPTSFLLPPTILKTSGTLQVNLTYSLRGKAKSFLQAPRVVYLAVEIYGPRVELAPSFHGAPKSRLSPPTVLDRRVYFGPIVHLAPSKRGQPQSSLKPPTVVRLAVEIHGPQITLARIVPKPTITALRPPTDVSDAQDIGQLKTHLAPSFRGKPKSKLTPPAVIERVFSLGPEIHLAPSFRGKPIHALKPPTVVRAAFVARPIQITLAQITPPPVAVLLKKPTVIGAGIAFYGPKVHLARIKPPKVIHFVITGEVEPFTPPHGHDCGFDTATSIICFLEGSGSNVSGSDQATPSITGTTGTGNNITGGDRSADNVIGGDQEAS